MKRIFVGLAAVSILAAVLLGLNHSKAEDPAPKGAMPQATVPVLAAKAEARDVPIILRGLGAVTAYNTVDIRSRVEGNITEIKFKEGQTVHAGDLLVQLDPRPYQAILDQAKANLARDQATLANAQTDLGRYADLLKRNFAPEQQFATQKATVSQDQSSIQADQAAIQAAQLNVDYAALRSPIEGVTGIRRVDVGNLVQANSTQTLVTVTQIQPIYVVFNLPEADIDRVRSEMSNGALPVEVYAANDERKLSVGKLDLIDNTVNQTTGTVQLKAEFENKDGRLWPGQFVNAHLVLRTVHDGVTVPSSAVQSGPDGSFVYRIGTDTKVAMTPVRVVQSEGNTALVSSGLKAGDQVVTAGQFKLQPGIAVKVADQLPDAGPALSDAPAGTDAAK